MKVLIVEDDPILNQNISDALKAEGYFPESVFDGLLAEKILKQSTFDCIILDINLPGKTGLDLCKSFRIYNTETPILMLTAFSELEDKIKGFDSGADDYLTKPFFMRELVLRLKSLINRSVSSQSPQKDKNITALDIVIKPAQKTVFRAGKEIALTPREYQILLKLCENQGEIISKKELIKEIWGNSFETNTNMIEVYINFLRNKVDRPFDKNSIKTKVGYGYYMDTE